MAVNLLLAQFDQYASSSPAGPAVAINPFTPISGANSLQFAFTTTSGERRLLVPKDGVGATKGLLRGRMRAAWRRSIAEAITGYGVTFAQSADNVIDSGNCYAVWQYRLSVGTSNTLRLSKHASGLSTDGTQLATSNFTATNTPVTIQVEWDISGSTALFEVWRGEALDYSDLVSQFTFEDTSSPLLTTTVEGFFWRAPGSTGAYTCNIDNIEVEALP